MSKHIKLTPEILSGLKNDFEESLKNLKMSDGKINFSKTFGDTKEKATVYFSELAWYKMKSLVEEFSKEVAWHGVASRGTDASKNDYYITDILVYPQTVTGATVDMDVKEYDKWIRDNTEDERFFNIAMQGHSHVNMQCSPSGTDLNHQEIILSQLTDDMFYIFMILNKQGSCNTRIFDLAKNTLFENADIDIKVVGDDFGVQAFIAEAKELVKEKTYQHTGYSYQPAYSWNQGNYSVNNKKDDKTDDKKDDKKDDKPNEKIVGYKPLDKSPDSSGKDKKKKGKRKKDKKRKTFLGNKLPCSIADLDRDDAFYYDGK